jgi:YegS/Rv2252/BmrU family lipid kinase
VRVTSVRPLVIVNPRAAGGRAGATFGDVRSVAERRLGPVDVAFTDRAGHAIELAREAARGGRELVIAVGGDGTMHEVANGVLEAESKVRVGFVGQGTGGDFRRTLGLEHRLDAYLDAIAGGQERTIDVGKVRYRDTSGTERTRFFVNILSAGLGGLVDRYVANASRALGGRATYFWASLRAIAASRRGRLLCDVSLQGESQRREVESFMIAICNGRYFGAGMHVAPMAQPDDGRFEVVSMDAPSKVALLAFSRRIYEGTHLAGQGVQHFACDRIAIDIQNEAARSAFLLDVDGEPLGGLPIDVEILPRALTLRA